MRGYSEESAQMHKLIGDPTHGELARYLDTNGDGSGTKDMNAAAATYRLKPSSGLIYIVDKIRLVGWDNVVASGATFVGIAALATGCLLEIREKPGDSDEEVVENLIDGITIKANGDLACLGDMLIINDVAIPSSLVQCIIKPEAPYRLDGNKGESLVFQTQDSLATLQGFRVMAIGRIYSNEF